ncbi:MAG TPA: helix-turn-helix domain-containing protein [Kofleriaceae bacterium]|jgi:AraC-like DNA-binding protein
MRPAIVELAYRHNEKPGFGLEILRLADLFARERRGVLPSPLSSPQRPVFHTIYLGLRGRGRHVVDFRAVPLGAGAVTVVARGRIQQFVPQAGLDAWMLVFEPEFLAPLAGARVLSPAWETPVLTPPRAELKELVALAALLAAEQARPLDAVQAPAMEALLRAIVLRLERLTAASGAAPPDALTRFFTILERDCLTTRSVEHYAKAAGISARRLGELLGTHAGRTTKQVVDERVVLEQKRLLAHTSVSVKELAERTGFAEPTNLVKFFRHHTGTTPDRFRKNLPFARRS